MQKTIQELQQSMYDITCIADKIRSEIESPKHNKFQPEKMSIDYILAKTNDIMSLSDLADEFKKN